MSEAGKTTGATELRSFKPYPAYKDSCVEWLGEIPAHWDARRLKFLSTIIMGQSPPSEHYNTSGDGLPFLQGNADFGAENPEPRVFCPVAPKTVKPGDHLISVRAPVGALNTADQDYGIGRGLCAVRIRLPLVANRFARWSLSISTRSLDTVAVGSTYEAVSADDVSNLGMPLPQETEQRAIAAFLDRETAKIDALLARKERLIELLKEKRTALINRVVTKGLDSNVLMKDSGVEWLGEIPAHWSLLPLGQVLTRITYGFTNPMPIADDGPHMVTANDIGDGEILFETARRTTREAFAHDLTDKSRPRAGDILVTKDGTLGRIAVADGRPLCINQSVALLRVVANRASADFVQNALRAFAYQQRMTFEAGGTAIKHIYVSRLRRMPVAFPPMNEQVRVCGFIIGRRARSDRLILRIREAIDRLKELRTALISAAVTGKIDVREEAT